MQKILQRQLGTVTEDCRFRVVNTVLQPQSVVPRPSYLPASAPWDTSDISFLVVQSGATLSHDSTRLIHRQATFTLLDPFYDDTYPPGEAPPIPYYPTKHFIHVSRVYAEEQSGVSFEVPLGYFQTLWPNAINGPGKRSITYTCGDLTSLIHRTSFISDLTIPIGFTGGYLGAIKAMLQTASERKSEGGNGVVLNGLTSQINDDQGPAIPDQFLQFNDLGNQPITREISFKAGYDRLQAVNDLAAEINYYPLRQLCRAQPGTVYGKLLFDLSPMPKYSDGFPPITFDYSTVPDTSIIEGDVAQTFDSQLDEKVSNTIRVIVSQGGAGGQDFSAIRTNSNPGSVISTANILGLDGSPRALNYVDTGSNAPNQAMVDLKADLLTQTGAMLTETMQVNTMDFALSEDYDPVRCQIIDWFGNVLVPSSETGEFVETAYQFPLFSVGGRTQRTFVRQVAI